MLWCLDVVLGGRPSSSGGDGSGGGDGGCDGCGLWLGRTTAALLLLLLLGEVVGGNRPSHSCLTERTGLNLRTGLTGGYIRHQHYVIHSNPARHHCKPGRGGGGGCRGREKGERRRKRGEIGVVGRKR